MTLTYFDSVGIVIYLFIAAFIYKKAWFYSFYSFFKFILVFILTLVVSLMLAAHTPKLPLTKLEQSLVIQWLLFIILWRIISFKTIFFAVTDGKFSLNRFLFMHHIDRYMSLAPSLVASFFITFSLFTVLVSASTGNLALQRQIETSQIVKPLSYKIYFAAASTGANLFQGVAYKLTPVYEPTNQVAPVPQNYEAVNSFKEKVNEQRQDIGLTPVGDLGTFIPTNVYVSPNGAAPDNGAPTPVQVDTQIFVPAQLPSPTPTPFPTPTLASQPNQQFPIFPIANPFQQATQPQQPTPTSAPAPTEEPAHSFTIPFVAPQADISQAEQDILRLTNQQRAQNGLGPLTIDPAISAVARAHSRDMSVRGFFDHINPDGLSPFDRMRIGGISFTTAGENIAGGPTSDIIMTNWMNSPGHRANILRNTFGRIGIGVVQDSTYGLMATQDFAN